MGLDPGRSTTTTAVVSASSPPRAPARTLGVTSVSDPAILTGFATLRPSGGARSPQCPVACLIRAVLLQVLATEPPGPASRALDLPSTRLATDGTRARAQPALFILRSVPGRGHRALPFGADGCRPSLNLSQSLLNPANLPRQPLTLCLVLAERVRTGRWLTALAARRAPTQGIAAHWWGLALGSPDEGVLHAPRPEQIRAPYDRPTQKAEQTRS